MAVVASYELIRRGKSLANLRTVVTNLRRHFPGIADTDAIERMLGAPASGPSTPPLFLDGVLASAMEPEAPEGFHLDYSSPWTIWRSDYPEMLDRDPAVVHPYLTSLGRIHRVIPEERIENAGQATGQRDDGGVLASARGNAQGP